MWGHEDKASLIHTVIRLVAVDSNGGMNRPRSVTKARGMSHSNQMRTYRMTDTEIELTHSSRRASGPNQSSPAQATGHP